MPKELKFSLTNCYGIKSLCHSFLFTNQRAHLIYAANGTMKTSLAKTLRYISNQSKEEPKDIMFSERIASFSVTVDGNQIQSENLFVFNGEDDIDSTKSFINFLASTELKQKYENIYAQLNKEKDALISKLKSLSLSTDCEKEIIDTFSKDENDTIFSILERLYSLCSDDIPCYRFKYNDIFDVKVSIRTFYKSLRMSFKYILPHI